MDRLRTGGHRRADWLYVSCHRRVGRRRSRTNRRLPTGGLPARGRRWRAGGLRGTVRRRRQTSCRRRMSRLRHRTGCGLRVGHHRTTSRLRRTGLSADGRRLRGRRPWRGLRRGRGSRLWLCLGCLLPAGLEPHLAPGLLDERTDLLVIEHPGRHQTDRGKKLKDKPYILPWCPEQPRDTPRERKEQSSQHKDHGEHKDRPPRPSQTLIVRRVLERFRCPGRTGRASRFFLITLFRCVLASHG